MWKVEVARYFSYHLHFWSMDFAKISIPKKRRACCVHGCACSAEVWWFCQSSYRKWQLTADVYIIRKNKFCLLVFFFWKRRERRDSIENPSPSAQRLFNWLSCIRPQLIEACFFPTLSLRARRIHLQNGQQQVVSHADRREHQRVIRRNWM